MKLRHLSLLLLSPFALIACDSGGSNSGTSGGGDTRKPNNVSADSQAAGPVSGGSTVAGESPRAVTPAAP